MEKYRVKVKNNALFGEFSSKEEASAKLMKFINDVNRDLGGDYLSPSDYVIEEVECKEVNEEITDFDSARNFIGIKSNFDFTVAKKRLSKSVVPIKGVARLVNEINHKHLEALIALNELFTIAEAWNKADGFVPDFSNEGQYKYYPWFVYDKDEGRFVCADANNTTMCAHANFGYRLCFQSYDRAAQFGKQFEELYNKVFL